MNLLKPFKQHRRRQPRDSLKIVRDQQNKLEQDSYHQRDELDDIIAHAVMAEYVKAMDNDDKGARSKELQEIDDFLKLLKSTQKGEELLQEHMKNRKQVVGRAA